MPPASPPPVAIPPFPPFAPEAAGGVCACDPGWTSPNCSVLALAPARWGPQRQAYETNTSSWGGNVIQDPATKLFGDTPAKGLFDGVNDAAEKLFGA